MPVRAEHAALNITRSFRDRPVFEVEDLLPTTLTTAHVVTSDPDQRQIRSIAVADDRSVGEDRGVRIEVIIGDIVQAGVEVLVTAANAPLIGGGGVDEAIHRAAGPRLLEALRPLAPCPPGGAVITPSFDISAPVRYIVHAVGPRYGVDRPPEQILASAYRESLARCDEVEAVSVAFPSLSTGAYGYPMWDACMVSVDALRGATSRVERCTLVAFDSKTKKFWDRALAATPS
jgi:O-acetyl-ADP-ribose deacetylase (regulator of RNase III)